jgi:hypothetical protein
VHEVNSWHSCSCCNAQQAAGACGMRSLHVCDAHIQQQPNVVIPSSTRLASAFLGFVKWCACCRACTSS